jgi:GNAT superfamily N-acetyltransferase
MNESIETHDMDSSDEYFVATCTHINESEEMDASGVRRLAWLRVMHERGSRVKVATFGGRVAGFLHAMPIEISPWGPLGRDLLVIPCLVSVSKGHGVGQALLSAAEEEARRQGRKGIVTIGHYHDFWFMPAAFFEAKGFSKRGRVRKGYFGPETRTAMLWRVFDKRVEAPTLLKRDYRFKPAPGKVVIDLFWNAFCQTSAIEAQRVREVAAESGESVVLNEYSADDRPSFLRHQTPRAIFVNGTEISWGYEAPKDGIRDAIRQALREPST